jgi:hypothetical protein
MTSLELSEIGESNDIQLFPPPLVLKELAAGIIGEENIDPFSLSHPTHRWSIDDGKRFGLGNEPGDPNIVIDWSLFDFDSLEENLAGLPPVNVDNHECDNLTSRWRRN